MKKGIAKVSPMPEVIGAREYTKSEILRQYADAHNLLVTEIKICRYTQETKAGMEWETFGTLSLPTEALQNTHKDGQHYYRLFKQKCRELGHSFKFFSVDKQGEYEVFVYGPFEAQSVFQR